MRHYFFEMAPGNTVAFFEIAGAETFAKGAGSLAPHPVQLDHLSYNVADEDALEQLRTRLLAATGLADRMDPSDSRLFEDPDPVPAVAELAAGGLTNLPTTRLQ